MSKILLIILCVLITSCIAKEIDFDVFDEKGASGNVGK